MSTETENRTDVDKCVEAIYNHHMNDYRRDPSLIIVHPEMAYRIIDQHNDTVRNSYVLRTANEIRFMGIKMYRSVDVKDGDVICK